LPGPATSASAGKPTHAAAPPAASCYSSVRRAS
jgi:hypothetical protein